MKKHILTSFLFLILSFLLPIPCAEILLENLSWVSLSRPNICNRGIAEAAEEEKTAKIDALLNSWIDKDDPGASVLVIYQGKIVFCNGRGVENLQQKKPITLTTKFQLASLSKPIFASAILLLEQQGKLSIDDPIVKYLPELNCNEEVTIRHLLTHTSGLYKVENTVDDALDALSEYKQLDNNDVVEILSEFNLSSLSPGDEYGYSNVGYECLPVIISRAAGMDFKEFMTKSIFTPMMMQNTGFDVGTLQTQGHYEAHPGQLEPTAADPFDSIYGAGGIYSTIVDLALFDQILYTDLLLSEELLMEAFTPFILNNGEVTEQGLGWGISQDHERGISIWHNGSWNGYTTTMYRFPQTLTTIIILCNRDDIDPDTLAKQILILCDKDTPDSSATDTSTDEQTDNNNDTSFNYIDTSATNTTDNNNDTGSDSTDDTTNNNGASNSANASGGLGSLFGGLMGSGSGGLTSMFGGLMGGGSGGLTSMFGGLMGGGSSTGGVRHITHTARLTLANNSAGAFTIQIWYPADTQGGPYPLIVFGHGLAFGTANQCKFFTEQLAGHGYVTCATNHSTSMAKGISAGFNLTPGYLDQPLEMKAEIDEILRLNNDSGSELYGMIDENAIGVTGHSCGGWAAEVICGAAPDEIYADQRVKAGCFFAPANSPYNMFGDPIDRQSGTRMHTASMWFFGTMDEMVRAGSNRFVYDAAPAPKYCAVISNIDHFMPAMSSQGSGIQTMGTYAAAFFDRYLKGDTSADETLQTRHQTFASYEYELGAGNSFASFELQSTNEWQEVSPYTGVAVMETRQEQPEYSTAIANTSSNNTTTDTDNAANNLLSKPAENNTRHLFRGTLGGAGVITSMLSRFRDNGSGNIDNLFGRVTNSNSTTSGTNNLSSRLTSANSNISDVNNMTAVGNARNGLPLALISPEMIIGNGGPYGTTPFGNLGSVFDTKGSTSADIGNLFGNSSSGMSNNIESLFDRILGNPNSNNTVNNTTNTEINQSVNEILDLMSDLNAPEMGFDETITLANNIERTRFSTVDTTTGGMLTNLFEAIPGGTIEDGLPVNPAAVMQIEVIEETFGERTMANVMIGQYPAVDNLNITNTPTNTNNTSGGLFGIVNNLFERIFGRNASKK